MGYDDNLLAKVITQIWDHGDIAIMKSDETRNMRAQGSGDHTGCKQAINFARLSKPL